MTVRIYRNKEFELLEGVYDPGDDSFMLVEAALKDIRPGEKVLEVGTGSGVVSFFVKEVTGVVATDINPIACQNARINGVEILRTDLFSGICGQFDVIIFNPPYLPTSEDERLDTWLNRAFDGGPDGRDVIRQFLAGVKRILPIGGRVLTVFSSLTDIDAVAELYGQHGFSVEIVAREKVPFEVLVVFKCIRLS